MILTQHAVCDRCAAEITELPDAQAASHERVHQSACPRCATGIIRPVQPGDGGRS